ncbi:MAG: crossover junction endodeoxyribonuclease RuvC [Clostridia bacterium]|nr:crossover junction endodeoxyribonuclease RuvC [Clostridia bacterium]
MIVLGIDPGLATVGFGVIKKQGNNMEALDYGVIKTPAGEAMPVRLAMIYDAISHLIIKYKPDAVAVEELFFNNNAKSAINVAQARGVSVLAAVRECGNIFEYTPLQIKQALTGYGRAEKAQIQFMVKNILKLKVTPSPVDAADALAAAITHTQTNQVLSKTSM